MPDLSPNSREKLWAANRDLMLTRCLPTRLNGAGGLQTETLHAKGISLTENSWHPLVAQHFYTSLQGSEDSAFNHCLAVFDFDSDALLAGFSHDEEAN